MTLAFALHCSRITSRNLAKRSAAARARAALARLPIGELMDGQSAEHAEIDQRFSRAYNRAFVEALRAEADKLRAQDPSESLFSEAFLEGSGNLSHAGWSVQWVAVLHFDDPSEHAIRGCRHRLALAHPEPSSSRPTRAPTSCCALRTTRCRAYRSGCARANRACWVRRSSPRYTARCQASYALSRAW